MKMDKKSVETIRGLVYHFTEMYRNWANTDINSVLKTKHLTAEYIANYSQYSADMFSGIWIGEFAKLSVDQILDKIGINDEIE